MDIPTGANGLPLGNGRIYDPAVEKARRVAMYVSPTEFPVPVDHYRIVRHALDDLADKAFLHASRADREADIGKREYWKDIQIQAEAALADIREV